MSEEKALFVIPDDGGIVKAWVKDGLQMFIRYRKVPYFGDFHCGYVAFPTRPVAEAGYDGFLSNVSVHGGITFAEEGANGWMIYGFDTGHSHSRAENQDIDWVTKEVERMALGIQIAVEFESRWLLAENNAQLRSSIEEAYAAEVERREHEELF